VISTSIRFLPRYHFALTFTERDSLKHIAQEVSELKSISFTNVKIDKTLKKEKQARLTRRIYRQHTRTTNHTNGMLIRNITLNETIEGYFLIITAQGQN